MSTTTTVIRVAEPVIAGGLARERWRGVLLTEDEQTGDGRFIVAGATEWETPFPLLPEHGTQQNCGVVDKVERVGNQIVAEGWLDTGTAEGREFVRMMRNGTAPFGHRYGLSIEPDDYAVELIDQGGVVEGQDERAAVVVASLRGTGRLPTVVAAAGDGEPAGPVVAAEAADDLVQRVTRLRIRAVAMLSTPAFAGAYLELAEAADDPITAAAALRFPRDLFERPEPDSGDQAFTVYADGSFAGHVHGWRDCHVGYVDRCLTAPVSPTGYARMNNTGGVINLTDGGTVNVAAFVMNCDHAPLWMPEQDVTDHYAHAGMVFGFGVVTQGRYGPWACGVLRPDITAEQLTVLQGMGQLSGDWREGDLYAVQAVSRAGFPKTRPLAASAAEGCSCGTSLAVLDAVGTDFVGLEAKIDLLLSRTAWMDSQAAEFYAHKIGL